MWGRQRGVGKVFPGSQKRVPVLPDLHFTWMNVAMLPGNLESLKWVSMVPGLAALLALQEMKRTCAPL